MLPQLFRPIFFKYRSRIICLLLAYESSNEWSRIGRNLLRSAVQGSSAGPRDPHSHNLLAVFWGLAGENGLTVDQLPINRPAYLHSTFSSGKTKEPEHLKKHCSWLGASASAIPVNLKLSNCFWEASARFLLVAGYKNIPDPEIQGKVSRSATVALAYCSGEIRTHFT